MTQLMKGNEAAIKGAILAGARAYFGYPITPASEIAETAARDFPAVGGAFLQAEMKRWGDLIKEVGLKVE